MYKREHWYKIVQRWYTSVQWAKKVRAVKVAKEVIQ